MIYYCQPTQFSAVRSHCSEWIPSSTKNNEAMRVIQGLKGIVHLQVRIKSFTHPKTEWFFFSEWPFLSPFIQYRLFSKAALHNILENNRINDANIIKYEANLNSAVKQLYGRELFRQVQYQLWKESNSAIWAAVIIDIYVDSVKFNNRMKIHQSWKQSQL